MAKTLDTVIIEILKASGRPLSVRQITEIIAKGKLWFRPKDNKLPDATQVSARVNNYKKYFTRENGIVTLKSNNESEDRLCKIVWNSNYWIKPVERHWNPSYIDDPNKGYEQKHGFVHEDWLFNSNFIFGGYQYGYIKGFSILNPNIKRIDTVYLFTINTNSKERFYVGKLHQVEHLLPDEMPASVWRTIRSYEKYMVGELKAAGADYAALKKDPFIPNVRFRIEAKELFPTPLLIESNWFDKKYARTTPMRMTSGLYSMFNDLERVTDFHFIPSTPDRKSGGYMRHTKEATTRVDKIHDEIEKALYNQLLQDGVSKSNIACDTTSFGGKIADVVIKVGEKDFIIYEIKTDTDVRRGLREAIGQLLDYATWQKNIDVRKIYAVLPYTPISDSIQSFVHRLKSSITLSFEILMFDRETKSFLALL